MFLGGGARLKGGGISPAAVAQRRPAPAAHDLRHWPSCRPRSRSPPLLPSPRPLVRVQATSDYVPQLEGFLPLLCRDANPRLPSLGDRRGGGGGGPEPAALVALRTACLRAVLEHLRFCARASYVSHHLDSLTYCVLDCMEQGAASGAGAADVRSARDAMEAGLDPAALLARGSVSARVGASPPDVAALLVFEQLSRITRASARAKGGVEASGALAHPLPE